MPRQPRYPIAGIPQHVIQRGNNRQRTFFADGDYRFYLGCLADAAVRHDCHVHAYVLMGNHVHLLMTPQQVGGIARVMQSVGRRYVRHVNQRYARSGTLWEGRYKASLVESDRYLLTCYRYIELNPVRAGIVDVPTDYVWSSCRAHALGRGDQLLVDHAVYRALGKTVEARCAAYLGLFERSIDDVELTSIRGSLNECRVLGGDRFKDAVEAALQRPVRAGRKGRPRKRGADPENPV